MKNKHIRKVAVLGAGVMGAQIAAHFANAGVPVVLYDLAGDEKDPHATVKKALAALKKLKPAPLAQADVLNLIQPANYQNDLPLLQSVDLIIEAVAERMDIKKAVYDQVAPHINATAIFATNTSGLSINQLGSVLSAELQERFCGVHFFNPPRYMHLVELIPTEHTDPAVIEQLEAILTSTVGKGVIKAKDTPNFIANRIGVFSMLCTMHHGTRLNIPFETIDALTGPLIGRAKSATFRTADVVGLDTLAHVINTMSDALPDDPWHEHFKAPAWMAQLIESGALGQKSGRGVYLKKGRDILVLDLQSGEYRPTDASVDETLLGLLKSRDPGALLKLRALEDNPQAQFLWSVYRDLFHYCATQLADIAESARDLDLAIRWGFGYQHGPFESWQLAGWDNVASAIQDDVNAGKTMAAVGLPAWVFEIDGPHHESGSYSPAKRRFIPRSDAPIYQRQLFPDALAFEQREYGETVFESEDFRLWHQRDGIAIASFKTKKHVISEGVLDGLQEAVRRAEADFKGLVVWQTDEPFSLGANLAPAVESMAQGHTDAVEKMVAKFQQTSQALRFSAVPTVLATRGLTLGGGCEFSMHASAVVAAFETWIGLVEAGVGLLPAGGGLKEIARRTADDSFGQDLYPMLEHYFKKVAMASVAGNAIEAKAWGLLKANTEVVFNAHEILYVAKQRALYMHAAGYRPPAAAQHIRVAGAQAIANMRMLLANMLEGAMISEHDYAIAEAIATVIAGGEVDRDSLVTEQYLLDLERAHFMRLIGTEKTQQRIAHTLKTGKPLRN